MKTLNFKIDINAPREKVWEILWGETTYPQWTSAFSEGSRAETDWKKGSKVLFLDGSNRGMVSKIYENVPNEYMSFQHLGMYMDGVEDFESEEVKKWAPSYENYTLNDLDGKTELVIDMEMPDGQQEMIDMFTEIWPKALNNLKQIVERGSR